HLLVMPVVPAEIMFSKIIANALVILVAAGLSLVVVVEWWLGVPIAGSLTLFLAGAELYAFTVAALGILLGTLATSMGQFGLLAIPVLITTPVGQRHGDGEHAGLAAIYDADQHPDAAFRRLLAGGALSRCRPFDRLASARRNRGDRQRLLRLCAAPFPPRDLWKLKNQVSPENEAMSETNDVEYRGYTLSAVQHGPGWQAHKYPGPQLLRTQPDHVLALTKEEALAKARAIVDQHLLG